MAWPAAILGCGLVYIYARHHQSPYVAAKSLVIAAPLVALVSGRALMERLDGSRWGSPMTVGVAVVAVVFFGAVLQVDLSRVARGAGRPHRPRHRAALAAAPAPQPPHARPLLRRLLQVGAARRHRVQPGAPIADPGRDPACEAVELRPAARLRLGGRRHAQPLRLRDHHAAPRLRASRRPTSTWWASRAPTRSGSAWDPRSRGACWPSPASRGPCSTAAIRLGCRLSRQQGVARVRPAPVSSPPVAPLVPGGSTPGAAQAAGGPVGRVAAVRQPAGGDRARRRPERAHASQPGPSRTSSGRWDA